MSEEELKQENEALKKRIGELKKLVWFESYQKGMLASNWAYWSGCHDHDIPKRTEQNIDMAIRETMRALGDASTDNFDYAVAQSEEKLNWARGKIWK